MCLNRGEIVCASKSVGLTTFDMVAPAIGHGESPQWARAPTKLTVDRHIGRRVERVDFQRPVAGANGGTGIIVDMHRASSR